MTLRIYTAISRSESLLHGWSSCLLIARLLDDCMTERGAAGMGSLSQTSGHSIGPS
jgi:hypothetical protein